MPASPPIRSPKFMWSREERWRMTVRRTPKSMSFCTRILRTTLLSCWTDSRASSCASECCLSLTMKRSLPMPPMCRILAQQPPPLSSTSATIRPRAGFASSFAAASLPSQIPQSISGS
ncbi:hypothetical protein BB8028_0006g08760 [Beauveria bassiana]|uniref:Uncharacterized protein n=1 Tax=Beauveria bassiana TaxID=176275 RepID=A0A2S7YKD0_BEABA|nr:hypothetical protein BB8028_0006g08760 [Beauveria bassiana]